MTWNEPVGNVLERITWHCLFTAWLPTGVCLDVQFDAEMTFIISKGEQEVFNALRKWIATYLWCVSELSNGHCTAHCDALWRVNKYAKGKLLAGLQHARSAITYGPGALLCWFSLLAKRSSGAAPIDESIERPGVINRVVQRIRKWQCLKQR